MKTREVVARLSALMNFHELEGGVTLCGGTRPEIQVHLFGDHPQEAAKWIQALDQVDDKSVFRSNAGKDNDIRLHVYGMANELRVFLHWNTSVEPGDNTRLERYRGKSFLAEVGFVKADRGRTLTDEELAKFLGWAKKEAAHA